ncbi:MAG: thioredoxin fold domain-containing protein [Acidobacteriota bacterium]
MRTNTMLLSALAALLLSLPACSVQSAQANSFDWIHDYEKALEMAKSQSKPIFAYLETDWCTYCRQMEQTTLKDQRLIEEMGSKFIWLKLNAERDEEGIMLRDRFGITSFPGMLILTSKGEEVDRLSGYLSSQEFRRKVDWLAHGPMAVKRLKERLAKTPEDAELHFQLAERRRAREEFALAAESYGRYLELDPRNQVGMFDHALYYQAAMLSMTGDVDRSLKHLLRLEGEFPQSRYMADAVLLKGQIYQHKGMRFQARNAFRTYLAEYPRHGFADQVQARLSRIPEDLPMVKSH